MTEEKLTVNRRNVAKSTKPRTLDGRKRKLSFVVLTIGALLLLSGCSEKATDQEIPKQLADQIRQAAAERLEVDRESLEEVIEKRDGGERRNQEKAANGREELFRRAEDLDQRIQILSVRAIREVGLDPLRYELDSTNLRPQLRTRGGSERLLMGKWIAEQMRPLLDERGKVEGEMTSAAAWLNELHGRLSYLKGAEYSKTEGEIQSFQARYDKLMPRLRELNERTNLLSSDVILATGHDPAWYELPTASTKEGEVPAPELIDRGQFYLVVYLKVPPAPSAPTLWEQIVGSLGFRPGRQR
jgi:hypothetical protein